MAFLFDTDAISELLRPHPATEYVQWLVNIPREEQFTSAVVIGELLYKGAYRSKARERHLKNLVTGNLRHFSRIVELKVNTIFSDLR